MEEEKQRVMQCEHCGNKTVFILRGSYEVRSILSENSYIKTFDVEIWKFWQCGTCAKPEIESVNQVARIEYIHPEEGGGEYETIIQEESDIVYPNNSTILAPLPSPDMPEDLAKDFNEARNIFSDSPRASAALLRLTIQKLCIHLGQPGKNINSDIAALVKEGLSVKIQQSLDIVRVIGNNAVHPGEIDLNDNVDIVLALFGIINFIVEEMITRPRELDKIYNMLPENARKSIEVRDKDQKTKIP